MKQLAGLGIGLLVVVMAYVDATSIRVKSPVRCGPICRMYCPNGFVEDDKGCPICKCNPFGPPIKPVLPPIQQEFEPAILPHVIPAPVKPTVQCGPMCRMYCHNGFVKDPITGCPICKCNSFTPPIKMAPSVLPPVKSLMSCGPICDMFCPFGNVLDYSGCPICRCKDAPSVVTRCPHGTKMALPRRACRRTLMSYRGRGECGKKGFCYTKGSKTGVCCRRRRVIKIG